MKSPGPCHPWINYLCNSCLLLLPYSYRMIFSLAFLLHPSYLYRVASRRCSLEWVLSCHSSLSSAHLMIAALARTQAAADHSVSSAGTAPEAPELATVLFSLSSHNGSRLAVGALLYGALLLYTSGFPQISPSEFPGCGLCHSLCSPSLPPPIS